MIKNLANFQKKVGINFHNQKLLTKSFTHKSYNPIDNNQLTTKEIKRCEGNEKEDLELITSSIIEDLPPRKKDTKYTPISLRQEKPYAILWLIKRYPNDSLSNGVAFRIVNIGNQKKIYLRDFIRELERQFQRKI